MGAGGADGQLVVHLDGSIDGVPRVEMYGPSIDAAVDSTWRDSVAVGVKCESVATSIEAGLVPAPTYLKFGTAFCGWWMFWGRSGPSGEFSDAVFGGDTVSIVEFGK